MYKQYKNTIYWVSEKGEIINNLTGKSIKQRLDAKGYYVVSIEIDGHRTTRKVHRLLAELFIPVPDELRDCKTLQVDHINRKKTDNRLSNLRWCSSRTNNTNRCSSKEVVQLSKDGIVEAVYSTFTDAARAFGKEGKHQMIQKAVYGLDRHKMAYGKRWILKSDCYDLIRMIRQADILSGQEIRV